MTYLEKYAMAQEPEFIQRVTVAMMTAAIAVAAESPDTNSHFFACKTCGARAE